MKNHLLLSTTTADKKADQYMVNIDHILMVSGIDRILLFKTGTKYRYVRQSHHSLLWE